MDVLIVPAGDDRHELYCEVAAEPPPEPGQPSPGFFSSLFTRSGWRAIRARWGDRFRRMLAEGEEDQHRGGSADGAPERSRLRRIITRKIAEAVAEQRLLWNLRDATAGRLIHPDDMDAARALQISRASFEADYAKHRRWCVIDGVLVAITGPVFFFVPGPNVVSWYFMFRAVGHFFAMRGASQGLSRVAWEPVPSRDLSAIRPALSIADEDQRCQALEAIAASLGLDRLARFVERVSARTT